MKETDGSVVVAGARIVRIRPELCDIGLGYRIRMWVVSNPRDRKRLGTRHLSREQAAKWVTAQGWRYIGTQY